MTLETIRDMLAWCSVINIGLLLVWGIFWFTGRDWIYRLHGKWFNIPVESFNTIHYVGMLAFKMGTLLFCLVPYLALRIVL